MEDQITIEDMNTFVEALRYSQTLVNTAQAGADLSYDFMMSYDYYGTVSMAVAKSTTIEASVISLSGYDVNKFYEYSEIKLGSLFYKAADTPYGAIHITPIGEMSDQSLLTDQTISETSILSNGSIVADHLAYDSGVAFSDADNPNILVPIRRLKERFYLNSDTIGVDSDLWKTTIVFGEGIITSGVGSSMFFFSGIDINSGITADNITFSSADDVPATILSGIVGSDRIISPTAILTEETEAGSNIFTLNKLNALKYMKAGDSIELHLSSEYTDTEIKDKIDTFMDASGSATVYTGEDLFMTKEQSLMAAEYIYRKITAISQATISI